MIKDHVGKVWMSIEEMDKRGNPVLQMAHAAASQWRAMITIVVVVFMTLIISLSAFLGLVFFGVSFHIRPPVVEVNMVS